jgi:CRP-like cAMP-binding protein
LDEDNRRQIISLLKIKKYPQDTVIIKKGDPAKNLYIILSGIVDVLNEFKERLSTLGKGDVFGEMSLISGHPVGADIKVVETATIVSIDEMNFKKVLNQFPSVQMYLARVLAKRLADSNIMRSDEIGLITGRRGSPMAQL